jgi:myo-inositol-1(or 4)-monophosphatase
LESLVDFAKNVIQLAGKEALGYYGRGARDLRFDERLITEAELHLGDLFRSKLQAQFPDHQVFQNERLERQYSHEEKRYLWIYDPLDGVANFQAGIPIWGISLALLENFWPIFGLFHMPATKDLFHARGGHKAFWGARQIRVPRQEILGDESLLFVYSRFHRKYQPTFPGKILNLGCTGAHICYVAMGRADAAVVANESFQGLAAACVIIEAAGGKIFRLDGTEVFLNEYLDGQGIDGDLLILSPQALPQIRPYLHART